MKIEQATRAEDGPTAPIPVDGGHYHYLLSRRESALRTASPAARARILGERPPQIPSECKHRMMVAGDLGEYERPATLTCAVVPPTPGFWWHNQTRHLRGSAARRSVEMPRVTVKQIMQAVANAATQLRAGGEPYQLAEMLSRRRARPVSWPRQVAMLLCVELRPDMSLPEIGNAFKKDHTTVMHARDVVPPRLADGEPMTTHLYTVARQSLAAKAKADA
jgi:hypothetical protein